MNIIIHSDEYYPTAQACAYRMQVLTDAFVRAGNRVTVITSADNKRSGAADPAARPERILYSPAVRMKKKTTVMRLLNNLSFAFTSVFTAAKAGRADVVITTSPPALLGVSGWLIAKLKHAKLVYDVRDIWPDVALEMGSFEKDSLYCKLFTKVTGFLYKHADLITTVTPGKVVKLDGYARQRDKRRPDKVRLVQNGFDESILDSAFDQEVVDRFGLDKTFTCVYIGNIGLAQGLGVLLDLAAATKHREVQFLFFGKGAEKEALEQRAADEGLTNVRFCGVLDHEKVFSVLSRAKISLIPLKSGKMTDSVPTKAFEALGIGCPVLLLAAGDAESLIEETGFGACVSPDRPQELPVVFDEMVDRYAAYEARREQATRLMREKYSRQAAAAAFEKELHALCGK